MPLDTYKQKRNFKKSPEPIGGNPTDKQLRFVVQKHHASHLHYDFRLELRGVLKSWAVPKGLSMNPAETRLAMLVEDHPWDYRNFEGIIPSGYGAGTVIVWDQGIYETTEIEEKDKKAQEHSITSQFWKGSIKFTLNGTKLKGSFIINSAPDKGDKAWYVQKLKDDYATKADVSKKDKSVLSKKTLQEVAANPEREWESHKPSNKKVAGDETVSKKDISSLLKNGEKAAVPVKIQPMLCTLVREPFTKEGWLCEVKWDGYRIVAYKNKNKIVLHSRSGIDYSDRYTVVHDALKDIKGDFVLDGEIVAFDKDGTINFDAVQKANPNAKLAFYTFDILWCNGTNIMQLPLTVRKEILRNIVPEHDVIKFSDHFADGIELYNQAQNMELEGIVAKNAASTYQQGKRGNDWLKIPTAKRQEFVIGGWAESTKARSFRSLLFGAYNKDKHLEWIGRSGGGYKEKDMPGILKKLQALEVNKSPFINKILDTKGAIIHYVKPELVANFKFATWTKSGRIRKPATFLGFRNDKKAKDVVREIPLSERQETKVIEQTFPASPKRKVSKTVKTTSPDSNWPELEAIKITSSEDFDVDDCTIQLSNIERELWKGITKADLIMYYNSMQTTYYRTLNTGRFPCT